jgi:Pentapeptide repeats (8 copies)
MMKEHLAEVIVKHAAWRRGEADGARADLSGADLRDAYLSGAYLSGADLSSADLSGADLRGADLRGAYLSDAYLRGADLRDAYLSGADLSSADLSGAYLSGVDLRDADLRGAYLRDAYLCGAHNVPESLKDHVDPMVPYVRKSSDETRHDRMMRYREAHPDVPVIPDLDARILACVEAGALRLEMSVWHGEGGWCGTTHCRAGASIHIAGEAGWALEQKYGVERAARMIYRASTGRVPHFFASNERALADIRACAAEQSAK